MTTSRKSFFVENSLIAGADNPNINSQLVFISLKAGLFWGAPDISFYKLGFKIMSRPFRNQNCIEVA